MCAFFARPVLSNLQFKQTQDSVLTLSGETQIATTTGLTLTDGVGGFIPIQATGASNNYVLTYDAAKHVINLKMSTTSGGTSIYDYTGLTTCAVGGLPIDQDLYNDELKDIIHCMVSPTLNPNLTNPTISTFSIIPSTTMYEVGCVSDICGSISFDAGEINPQYSALCDERSNGTLCYMYTAFGVPSTCIIDAPSVLNYSFGTNVINYGSNSISAKVCYCGGVQPYDSEGTIYDSPLSTGVTNSNTKTITGIYPWFWGIESSGGVASGENRPDSCCIKDIITGGTGNKVIESSTGTIYADFNSTNDDYLWFATPADSTTKTVWYVDALNNDVIGGGVSAGGNLFPTHDVVNDVDTVCWSGQSYKIYVSNYQSAAPSTMELRNN